MPDGLLRTRAIEPEVLDPKNCSHLFPEMPQNLPSRIVANAQLAIPFEVTSSGNDAASPLVPVARLI